MQWLDTPLQPKGPRFETSFEFVFHPQTKWMKINCPWAIF
jgi:hypothetical protein